MEPRAHHDSAVWQSRISAPTGTPLINPAWLDLGRIRGTVQTILWFGWVWRRMRERSRESGYYPALQPCPSGHMAPQVHNLGRSCLYHKSIHIQPASEMPALNRVGAIAQFSQVP